MTTKKKISEEVTVMDKLNDLGVTKDQLFNEGNPDIDEESDKKTKGVPVLVVDDGSDQFKLMKKELSQHKHFHIVTEVKNDLSNIVETIPELIKKELKQGNKYSIIYLPLDNDDLCANNSQLLTDIANCNVEIGKASDIIDKVFVTAYFDGHEKAETKRRIKQLK